MVVTRLVTGHVFSQCTWPSGTSEGCAAPSVGVEGCGVVAASVTHASELALGSIERESEPLAASALSGGAGVMADAARSALWRGMRLACFGAASYRTTF